MLKQYCYEHGLYVYIVWMNEEVRFTRILRAFPSHFMMDHQQTCFDFKLDTKVIKGSNTIKN